MVDIRFAGNVDGAALDFKIDLGHVLADDAQEEKQDAADEEIN